MVYYSPIPEILGSKSEKSPADQIHTRPSTDEKTLFWTAWNHIGSTHQRLKSYLVIPRLSLQTWGMNMGKLLEFLNMNLGYLFGNSPGSLNHHLKFGMMLAEVPIYIGIIYNLHKWMGHLSIWVLYLSLKETKQPWISWMNNMFIPSWVKMSGSISGKYSLALSHPTRDSHSQRGSPYK